MHFFVFYSGSCAAAMLFREVEHLRRGVSLAIHLVCLFCFISEELDEFLGFSNANVRAVGAQLLDKVKGGRYEILEESVALELAHLFL